MKRDLAETLAMVAEAAGDARDPWWIVGSAAVVLHGGAVARVKDVDLKMSAADAERFLRRVGGEFRNTDASDRFRSQVFGIWTRPPIAVEVFGGFSLAAGGGWREVSLATREPVTVGGARVYVPSREELVRLLQSFGRVKDLERVRALTQERRW